MSLKHFHILFISAATLLCFGFGLWGLLADPGPAGNGTQLLLGVLSLVLGVVLIVYGVKVFQKLKTL